MPKLQDELDQLALADRHIATGVKGIAEMQHRLEIQRGVGGDIGVMEDSVSAAQQALQEFQIHRDLIAQTIQDIRTGRLPST
jgi:hypothetical protein